MKKLLFLFLVCLTTNAQGWKVVGSKVYPSNKFYTVSLREGLGTGFQLGWNNPASPDSGMVRYISGSLQYYDGGAWQTVGTGGAAASFTKPEIDTVGTVVDGVWQGASIDTAYLNAVSKLTAGWGITATKNAKDYTVKVDSATLSEKYYRREDTASTLASKTWSNGRFAITSEHNTFSSGTTQTMPRASIDTLDMGSVVLISSAGLRIKKANIQTAIDDAGYGDAVLVYPGDYSEDVVVPDSGITLEGIGYPKLKYPFVITGKDIITKNIQFDSTFTFNSQETATKKYNIAQGCIFTSSVKYGTELDTNIYGARINGCLFRGDGDTMLVRTKSVQAELMNSHFEVSENNKSYTLYLANRSKLTVYNCGDIFFDGIIFDCTSSSVVFDSFNCGVIVLGDSTIRAFNNETNYAIFSVNNSYVGYYGNDTAWTFERKFEVDFRHCYLAMPDIIWNSTAHSRWEYSAQRIWNSTATLTGTAGALDNLYVTNSVFRLSEPAGLGSNSGTYWEAWIDD
jgi:hypothetical protein